ncbi:MAG: hypothetical protein KME46_33125 [Brasilonema angustatum HA4187-MV1]|nr:hypothetical protein [Brasilonema angustatum HA4187-MV1]
MAESKKVQQIFQKYCEFQGSLELFAQSQGISLKSCTTWAKKYDWEVRKSALMSGVKPRDQHVEFIRQTQENLLTDSDNLRKTVLSLVARVEKSLASKGTILDPDRSVSMLPSLIESLIKCHDLSLKALGVGEVLKVIDLQQKPEGVHSQTQRPQLALAPREETTQDEDKHSG